MSDLSDAIEGVLSLQSSYDPANKPAMKQRGSILRHGVKLGIDRMRSELAAALGPFGGDFLVEASDGIGRKTELPWGALLLSPNVPGSN